MNTILGIELGSTRIKAVTIDQRHQPVASGGYTWAAAYENGIWTYPLELAWTGLKAALSEIPDRADIAAAGLSGMMHGYLAFDKDWNLLTPFRTWQNTITGPAAAELTALFGYNIPQRWTAAHLYQAVLNQEEHIGRIAHVTSLAGYLHYRLTGVNAVGLGEASGMFPVDSGTLDYDQTMMEKFEALLAPLGLPWKPSDVLPKALPAGREAGRLTAEGAALLDGLLPEGLPFAPPEGDAGTGMTATNAVAVRTGNVSAGTSIFSMVVLERPLTKVYEEIDLVTTPAGRPVAMVHGNNCTNDTNAWVRVLEETANLFGAHPSTGELYTKLYEKSLEGDADCGGVLVCNYMAGEGVTHLDSGRPLVARLPDCRFTLANFFRSQLYATMATLRIGMEILAAEDVAIDSMTAHGGLFKTPLVGQTYMAAVCGAPVTCMATAGEGGPFGMALLAAFMLWGTPDEPLEDYLAHRVFAGVSGTTVAPDPAVAAGVDAYVRQYRALLEVERAAVAAL
ncbi:MAG: ATPase [Oscillospiraceae bacterium]|nr:ATPase [Oscillospiraceae bacterium]